MASTKSVVAAAKSIPTMKENLRKAFEELQSHSSSLASFTLQWTDIDDHFSRIEKSIQVRLKELESKAFSMPEKSSTAAVEKFPDESGAAFENFPDELEAAAVESFPYESEAAVEKISDESEAAVENIPDESEAAVENFPDESEAAVENIPDESEAAVGNFPDESEATPRPQLKSLCLKLDGKGLPPFINKNSKDIAAIRKEIIPALRLAPDPAKLVLEAVEEFHSPKPKGGKPNDAHFRASKKSCILLLEGLHVISPEIKPRIKEKAKKLVLQWKGKIQNSLDAMVFLQFLVSYDMASEIKSDEIMDAMVSASGWKEAIKICRNLGLGYKVPDLIGKLNSEGKQLAALKFVHAFDLVDKFPPVSLLKAYIKESKKSAQEVLKRGDDSKRTQNHAKFIEIKALKSVIKAVEEHKLESEYSLEDLNKCIARLKPPKPVKKRYLQATANQISKSQEQPSKRHRSYSTTTPSAAATSAAATSVVMAYPTASISHSQNHGSAWPQGLSGGGPLYNHMTPSLVGNPLASALSQLAMCLNQSQAASHAYPAESSLMGSNLYTRPMSYGSYPPPGGLPSHQFNPSL